MDSADPTAAPEGRLFLIAGGTACYRFLEKDLQLPSVENDLSSMVELFTGRLGYERVLEGLGDDPTVDYFQARLSKWLTDKQRKASDRIVFYYTGHGVLKGNEHYLMMYDSEESNVTGTAFLTASLARMLSETPIREVMVILDTCHSAAGSGDLGTIARGNIASMRLNEEISAGFRVIAAARPREEAAEGAFAEEFIRAVKEPPDACGGVGQAYLSSYDDLIGAINREFEKKKLTQRASVDSFGVQAGPRFLRNLRNPSWAGVVAPPAVAPPVVKPTRPAPPDPIEPGDFPRPVMRWTLRGVVETFGWLTFLLGVISAVCGVTLKTGRFVGLWPSTIRSLTILSTQDWCFVVFTLIATGWYVVGECMGDRLRRLAWAFPLIVTVAGLLAWSEFEQYSPTYQIRKIRENGLLKHALGEDDPRRVEVATNWAVALALDDQVAGAFAAAAEAAGKNGPDDDSYLAVARALERIRHPQAKVAWDEAAKAARARSPEEPKCRALAALARAEVAAGQFSDARGIAEEAQAIAEKPPVSASTLVTVLVSYGQSLTRGGKDEDAKAVWKEAQETADGQVKDPSARYLAVVEVTRGAAAVGENRVALPALTRSRELSQGIEGRLRPEDAPDAVAADVTELFVGERRIESARALAPKIRGPRYRARAFIAVARGLDVLGRADEARVALGQAVAACAPSDDHASRSLACAAVATDLDRRGQSEQALPYWDDALGEMRELSEAQRLDLYYKLLEGLARSGRFDKALGDAGRFREEDQRSAALTHVGQVIALDEVRPPDLENLKEADSIAHTINKDQWHSAALAVVAKGFARLDKFRDARLKATECRRSLDELDVYALILTEFRRAARHP